MVNAVESMVQVRSALPDVDSLCLPSVHQYNLWRHWVRWVDGCDADGWFLGTCPLHDLPEHSPRSEPAHYNFAKNTFKCDGDCHVGKRGMTLVEVLTRIAGKALNG